MLLILLISMFELFWCLSNMIIKPRMISYEKGLRREADCKSFDLNTYRKCNRTEFNLLSDFGYSIHCELIQQRNQGNRKIAVLCHGFCCARYSSMKYMELFLKLGFSVLMYDHRNHGLSGKAFTSMGFYEKYDLKKVIDWCYRTFGEDIRVVTHGESMGASTVLLHLGIDDRVKCAIADCAFSDLTALLRHQLKQYYHLPCLLIPYVSGLTYLRAGFRYKEVSPAEVIAGVETPVLFIHGKIDNLVPPYMSRLMYDCKKKNKAIYMVAKARHACSYCKNRDGYERRVKQFLNSYLK